MELAKTKGDFAMSKTETEIDAMAGWIVLGRAPKRPEMSWKDWEPMAEDYFGGHRCLLRYGYVTIFATEAAATEAVKGIKVVCDMFGLDWHRNTEFRLVEVRHPANPSP